MKRPLSGISEEMILSVITSAERYEKICLTIIDAFDRIVPDFYDLEDRQRGLHPRGDATRTESVLSHHDSGHRRSHQPVLTS